MKSTYNQAQTANTAKHSGWYYCAFQKHANSKVQKPLSQLRFSLPSIIITIPSNEPWNTETHITDRNPPITNHKAWPFEPVRVKFRFLRGPSRWLTAAKNAIVSWLLNFRIRMFVKSVVTVKTFQGILKLTLSTDICGLLANEKSLHWKNHGPSSQKHSLWTLLYLTSFLYLDISKFNLWIKANQHPKHNS